MTAIKICGICTLEHARFVAAAGADMIGFVFAPSRRRVTPEEAFTMIQSLRQDGSYQGKVVGLFVNERIDQINAIAHSCGVDYVQLSGNEEPEHAVGICCPVIKTLRLDGTPAEEKWFAVADNQQQSIVRFAPCPFIIDSHVAGSYGGTGVVGDWKRAKCLAQQYPLMLAGGLTPKNVASAIAQVKPWGVDVSSGVEMYGTKDTTLIEAFIRAVRTGMSCDFLCREK